MNRLLPLGGLAAALAVACADGSPTAPGPDPVPDPAVVVATDDATPALIDAVLDDVSHRILPGSEPATARLRSRLHEVRGLVAGGRLAGAERALALAEQELALLLEPTGAGSVPAGSALAAPTADLDAARVALAAAGTLLGGRPE